MVGSRARSSRHEEGCAVSQVTSAMVEEYISSFEWFRDPGKQAYWAAARDRLLTTLNLIPRLPDPERVRVLEIGGMPYFMTVLVEKLFGYKVEVANEPTWERGEDLNVEVLESDHGDRHEIQYKTLNIEYDPWPWEDGHFDIVLYCTAIARGCRSARSAWSRSSPRRWWAGSTGWSPGAAACAGPGPRRGSHCSAAGTRSSRSPSIRAWRPGGHRWRAGSRSATRRAGASGGTSSQCRAIAGRRSPSRCRPTPRTVCWSRSASAGPWCPTTSTRR